jgi:hypothetical protein
MAHARPPLLFLDVDGVIALLGPGTREEVFETVAGEFPVRIASATPARLRRLADRFQIVFCTSWAGEAGEHIAPLVGLPADLPYLPHVERIAVPPGSSWKLPGIERMAGDHPAAVVDDEIGNDMLDWAERRDAPTLIVEVDPRHGLQEHHFDELLRFAAAVERSP